MSAMTTCGLIASSCSTALGDGDQRQAVHAAQLLGQLQRDLETAGIDVLVDLMGFTMHNRLDLLARGLAPIQVVGGLAILVAALILQVVAILGILTGE